MNAKCDVRCIACGNFVERLKNCDERDKREKRRRAILSMERMFFVIVGTAIATVIPVKEEKASPSSKRQGTAAIAQRNVRSRPSPPSSPPSSPPPLETYPLAPPVPPPTPTPTTTRIQKI